MDQSAYSQDGASNFLPGALPQMNGLIVFTITGGLLLDYHWLFYGQAAASAMAWLVCIGLWARADANNRVALAA